MTLPEIRARIDELEREVIYCRNFYRYLRGISPTVARWKRPYWMERKQKAQQEIQELKARRKELRGKNDV